MHQGGKIQHEKYSQLYCSISGDSNYKYHANHFAAYRNIKPLYCAPRTNIVL